MNTRPKIQKGLSSETFRNYYYLKEELVEFCRKEGLKVGGGKLELTERIATYLESQGKEVDTTSISEKEKKASGYSKKVSRQHINLNIDTLTTETLIEDNFVCTEVHRAFFKEKIGKSFTFNVAFQKWLKSNTGSTYQDAIDAYYRIKEEKKSSKTIIDKQFEYNTYIRDFFADNKGRSLEDAICCWKYKKSLPGHNRYEKADLKCLFK